MRYIIILLLLTNIAQAQTTRVQTVSSGMLIWTAAGVDSAKARIRAEQQAADKALADRIAALESNVVRLRPGTVDSLNRLSVLLTDLSTRIAQQGASLSSLNATVAGNVAGDNAQAVQISSLVKQIGSYDTLLPIIQAAVKAAQDTANGVQGQVKQLTEQQSGVISRLETTEKQQAAQQAVLNKVEAWIRSY